MNQYHFYVYDVMIFSIEFGVAMLCGCCGKWLRRLRPLLQVEMTSLSPRVIRVWFQNKRCKDKKKAILMKQIQQQEKVN